jgi:hypothetical protein
VKEIVRILGGALLAVALLYVVLHGVDRGRLWQDLRGASIGALVLGSLINLAHNVFRIWRWRVLLRPVRADVAFRPMMSAVIIGYMTSWVLPGRLGEVVRPGLLSAKEPVPLGPCLGSVVADRLLDGVAIVMLFVAGSFLLPLRGEAAAYAGDIRTAAVAMLLIISVPLVTLVLVQVNREDFARRFGHRRGVVGWVARTLLGLAHGTEALRSPWLLTVVTVQSLLAWLTIGLGTWIGVRAAGARVPYVAILVMLPMIAFGVALPTPGGAGGYHAAMKFGLWKLFGVSEETAVAAGLLMHLGVVVPVIVLGVVLLRTERISWHDLIAVARQVRDLGAGGRPPVAASNQETAS